MSDLSVQTTNAVQGELLSAYTSEQIGAYLFQALQEVDSFARAEVPLFIQDFISFSIFRHFSLSLLFTVVFCCFIFWACKLMKLLDKDESDIYNENCFWGAIFFFFMSVVASVPLLNNVYWLVVVYFWPKVYLFYEFKSMMGK